MSRLQRLLDLLSLRPARAPAELLAAMFAAACEGGMNARDGLAVVRASAERFDRELAAELSAALLRLEGSVDRVRTLQAISRSAGSEVLRRLFAMLAWAEANGEDSAARARQIFEELLARREMAVARRSEVYPILMIVLMVLFFMPAVLMLLVGPSYILLLEVLRNS